MKGRLLFLSKLFLVFILIFSTQKVLFMLVNLSFAGDMTFGDAICVLWHALRLDTVASSYLVAIPAVIILVSLFFERFPIRRVLTPYYLIISLLMSVLFVADIVIYHFWGAKIDANDLIYAVNFKDLFASVSTFFVICGIIVIVLFAWLYLWCLRHITPVVTGAHVHLAWAFMMLPLYGLIFLGIRGSVKESTANPGFVYHSSKPFQNHAALNPLFNMAYTLFKVDDLAHEFQFFTDAELGRYTGNAYLPDGRICDTLLSVRHPDIVIIIWEGGGSDVVMNDSVGPNIMRLGAEGVYFSNCFANSFRTDRGMTSLLSGWPGLPTASLMIRAGKCGRLPSIARTLREQGYHTRFVYGGDIDFTNMRGYLAETGYIDVRGDAQLPKSRHLSNWGAPDEYVLDAAASLPPSPGFTTVLTLSSHEPWDVPYRRLPDDRKNSFAYTDSCIGAFVDRLRSSPGWENLLVIITPDHGIPVHAGQSTGDWRVAHVPVIMVGGAIAGHREIDRLMNQSDIAATLLAQMGLSVEAFPLSRNVLGPSYSQLSHFAIHACKNGINYIDSTGVSTFDCISQEFTDNGFMPSPGRERMLKAILQLIYKKSGGL